MKLVALQLGLACALGLAFARTASAQDDAALSVTPDPSLDELDHTEAEQSRNVEYGRVLGGTGYLLPAHEAEVGIVYAGYGITDWLCIGTLPAPWIIAPMFGGVSANLSIKAGFAVGRWLNVGLDVNPLWIGFSTTDTKVRAFLLPVTLAASLQPVRMQSYSLAVRYAAVTGKADNTRASQEIAGAAITSEVQLLAQAQWQLTSGFALYVEGNLALWQQNLHVRANGTLDERTTVNLNGEVRSSDILHPWLVLGGVHLHWGFATLRVGAGYGHVFIPRVGLVVGRYRGVVPDVNFFVRF